MSKIWEFELTHLHQASRFLFFIVCTIGCPKMHLFPWNIPWPGAKESLSDVGFENIFVFKFCSSPERAIVKNLFADFRKFITEHFLWIYIIFNILTQPKNPRIFFFFYNFQRHSYNICAGSVSAHAHNAIFVIWVWAFLARIVDEIENNISKIIL